MDQQQTSTNDELYPIAILIDELKVGRAPYQFAGVWKGWVLISTKFSTTMFFYASMLSNVFPPLHSPWAPNGPVMNWCLS